jgi:hypothetical protein
MPAPGRFASRPHFFAIFAAVISVWRAASSGAGPSSDGSHARDRVAPLVLFSPSNWPAGPARQRGRPVGASGFSDGTVWLIFGAWHVAYEKTGFGRRSRRSWLSAWGDGR